MDRFDTGAVTLGGAPFNLSFHLHQLLTALELGEAVFVSAIGNDEPGDEIRAKVGQSGMSTDFLTTDPIHPTGAALVFTSAGEAGFEILQNVAWDYLRTSPALDALALESQGVVFGSLAQRSLLSRATIQRFVSQVAGPRLYDVNLRRNTTNSVAGYTPEIITQSLNLATIVKMNDAEIDEIAAMLGLHSSHQQREPHLWDLMQQILSTYDLAAITVTRGPLGALLLGQGKRLRLADSTLPAHLVHPVGAGDSFAAGLLFGIVRGWSLEDALALAEIISSWVVLHVAATPTLTPDILAKIRTLAAKASQ